MMIAVRAGLVTILAAMPFVAGAATAVSPGHDAALQLYYAGRLDEARVAYLDALKSAPDDFRMLLELSRAESELSEDAEGEGRRRLGAAAVDHARQAARIAPERAECHLALAIALGRQALREGPRTRLAMAREVKADVDRTIELDPANGLAFLVRGVWNREVASLGLFEKLAAQTVLGGLPRGASMENALADLRRAADLTPTTVLHWLELGRTCTALGRRAEARRALEKVIALPPTSGPRDAVYQKDARAMLRKLNT
jgi:Flp pilus assembly protein TadD